MITREDGWIAVKYHQPVPHVLSVHGREYAFVVKFNINMAWIHPDDYDAVMAVTTECCGGAKKPKYRLANQLDVERWSV